MNMWKHQRFDLVKVVGKNEMFSPHVGEDILIDQEVDEL